MTIGSYKLSQCCESSSEERSAGNPHATFCGNRGRATASGDPVGGIARCPPIPILGGKPSFGALKTVVGVIEFVTERNGLKLTTFSKSLNVGAWAAAAVPGWRIPQGAAPRRKERQL